MSHTRNWRDTKKVTIENAHKAFEGKMFDVYQWEQELYDGSYATFERIVRPDTVTVLAVTKEKKILLTRQEQPGMEPFVDFPGGRVDLGLPHLETAKVELLEEAGYEASEWQEWFHRNVTPKLDWKIYVFLAYDCVKKQEAAPEAGEKIELFEATYDEFIEILKEGRMRSHDILNKVCYEYFRTGSLDWLSKLLRI